MFVRWDEQRVENDLRLPPQEGVPEDCILVRDLDWWAGIPSKPFSLFRKADVRLAPVNVHFRDK